LWFGYDLHKCCLHWIYAIIPYCVLMTIDAIVHFWSFTFRKLCKHMRTLKDIQENGFGAHGHQCSIPF
jgi:hypothetical protein